MQRLSSQDSMMQQHGVANAEFVVVAPILFLVMLMIVQVALMIHAKTQVYYATYEAARVASAYNPKRDTQGEDALMRAAFKRAIVGYFGGGATQQKIDESLQTAENDLPQSLIIKSEKIDDKYIKVTTMFGIPKHKQVPWVGQIIAKLLTELGINDADASSLASSGMIPVYAEVTMHLSPVAMNTPPWRKEDVDIHTHTGY